MIKNHGGIMKKTREKGIAEKIEDNAFEKLEEGNECEKYSQKRYEEELGIWTTVNKAAAITGRHTSTIYRMIGEGTLISRKYGNKISILSRSLIFANGDRMK